MEALAKKAQNNMLKSIPFEDGKNSNINLRKLTRTLAVRDLEGPLVERTLRATSAAACSACLSVLQ